MATLKTTNVQHPDSPVANITLLSDGSVGGELGDVLGSKLDLAGGKILQIVRATDSTERSTTSTSFVDASLSVTITPQKSDSVILLLWALRIGNPSSQFIFFSITDNSNNEISGANGAFGSETALVNNRTSAFLVGYNTPATTSATTYKGRFRSSTGGAAVITNASQTGQLYAIEVSA